MVGSSGRGCCTIVRQGGGIPPRSIRAWDEAGNIQPTRAELFAERGDPKTNPPVTAFPMEHINAITSWAIDAKGETKHVYT